MKTTMIALAAFVCASMKLTAEDKAPPPPPAENTKPADAAAKRSRLGAKGEAGHGAMLGEMLKRMDTNGDGKVSKEEFMEHMKKEGGERFSRLDTNKDGFVDKAEAEEAAKKMREHMSESGESGGKLRERMKNKAGTEGGPRKRPETDAKKPTT